MARRLGNDLCELKIQDNISGSEIVLQYRMPTTQERMAYSNESFQRKRNKLVSRLAETRQKFGTKILAGIREGDFEKKMGSSYVPIASDTASKHYDADWRKHIEEHASDLIELLAAHVFDVPAEMADEDSLEAAEDIGPKDPDPGPEDIDED